MSSSPDMQSAARTFFTASSFAVAGASSTPSKFGYKVFVWYLQRQLPTTPLNPTQPSVEVYRAGHGTSHHDTAATVSDLSDPKNTSLSVITPPGVTAKLLKEAKEAGIKAVWLQPGSFNDEILEYAVREFPGAAVGGFADGTVGGEGWCVLVDGDQAIKAAGRNEKL